MFYAGESLGRFLDVHDYSFKVNPHFKVLKPVTRVTALLAMGEGSTQAEIRYYLPVDYWYLVEPLPYSFWTSYVDIVPFSDPNEMNHP